MSKPGFTFRYEMRHFSLLAAAFQMIFGLLATTPPSSATAAESTSESAAVADWAIALHGGAGRRSREMSSQERHALEQSLLDALASGQDILASGGAALDAVEAVVIRLENDPQFNAGKGAVFTRAGEHELDASMMDGATLRGGAVAGVKYQKNPITAARLVMEHTRHLLLAGDSADRFAAQHGGQRVEQQYFYTARRFNELQSALTKAGLELLPSPAYPLNDSSSQLPGSTSIQNIGGTVGCVARDVHGNLAAATSTGGLTAKIPGRVGDSPICGAGCYADNRTCAVSTTGKGEEFMRHSIAARLSWLIADQKLTLIEAAQRCIDDILRPGDGGLIAVDRNGHIVMHSSTDSMPRASADSNGRREVAIWTD